MATDLTSHTVIYELLQHPEPIRWVFAGDSITHGWRHTMGWRDYTEIFSERVRGELRRLRDVVIKTAVKGWRVSDLRADLEWSVLQHRPHVLSIALGMNDCTEGDDGIGRFAAGLDAIVGETRLRSPGTALILHTPPRILPVDPERIPHLSDYVDAIRRKARSLNAVLIDHYDAWLSAEQNDQLTGWLSDGIHPNEVGHRVMARLLLRELNLWGDGGITASLYPSNGS